MPIVTISGFPSYVVRHRLIAIKANVRRQMLSVTELGLARPEQVDVLFPPDLLENEGDQLSLTAHVCLFEGEGRTDHVFSTVANLVCTEIMHQFPEAKIDVFMHPFDRTRGYWQYKP